MLTKALSTEYATNPLQSCAVQPLDKSARAPRVSRDLSIFQALNPFLPAHRLSALKKLAGQKSLRFALLRNSKPSPLNQLSFDVYV